MEELLKKFEEKRPEVVFEWKDVNIQMLKVGLLLIL